MAHPPLTSTLVAPPKQVGYLCRVRCPVQFQNGRCQRIRGGAKGGSPPVGRGFRWKGAQGNRRTGIRLGTLHAAAPTFVSILVDLFLPHTLTSLGGFLVCVCVCSHLPHQAVNPRAAGIYYRQLCVRKQQQHNNSKQTKNNQLGVQKKVLGAGGGGRTALRGWKRGSGTTAWSGQPKKKKKTGEEKLMGIGASSKAVRSCTVNAIQPKWNGYVLLYSVYNEYI